MKKIYLPLLTLLLSLNAYAYPDFGLWCRGQAMLENGEIVEGNISFDLKFQAVRIKVNGVVHAYSAESIAYFEMFDHIKKIHRKYVSLDSPVHAGYSRKAFFEVISHGILSYLRQSEYVRRPRATEDMRAPHIYLNTICRHAYYLHDKDEGLVRVTDFSTEVLPRMTSFEEEVDKYIDRCGLGLRKLHEQVRVINLYNQLHATKDKLAIDLSQSAGTGSNLRQEGR